jgi:hypothetical protein
VSTVPGLKSLRSPLARPCGATGALVAAALATLAACTTDGATVITVRARPSVIGATALTVELKNGAGLAANTFSLGARSFPVTFSVSTPGRSGDLELVVSARNGDLVVGRGTATLPIDAEVGEVLIDSTDFVVNTDFADDQYLTNDYEAVGSQIATNAAGEWLVTFRERCTAAACNVFARRFSATGQPLSSALAAGTNAFAVNTGRVGVVSSSAAAAGADRSLLFWETTNATDSADGVACRPIDRGGAATAEQRIVTEPSTDVVMTTALPDGNFAAVWSGRTSGSAPLNLRTVVVTPSCSPMGTPRELGQTVPTVGLRQSSVATGPDAYFIAWRADGTIRGRTVGFDGVPASADTLLLSPALNEEYTMVRVAAYQGGFLLVAARRAGTVISLELARVSASKAMAPAVTGTPTRITDGLDSVLAGFSVASHPQGPALVTWHMCGERGDGDGCGVFGRRFDVSGAALDEAFVIPTTTVLAQENSSVRPLVASDGAPLFVVAWNDFSATAPDTSGQAVRARILYPPEP